MLRTRKKNEQIQPVHIHPLIAGIASLLVPGLGQMITRFIGRGLLLLASGVSIIGLLSWRIQLLAHLERGPLAIFTKAFSRRPAFVGFLVLFTVVLWLWNVIDAYLSAKTGRKKGAGIFILVLVLFFVLGWQISQINLYKAVTGFPEAMEPLGKVLWPWKAAITFKTEVVKAGADILEGCSDTPPPEPELVPGKPYLKVEPRCGDLSKLDSDNQIVAGTELTLWGRNFTPDTETQIWWIDPLLNEFRPRYKGEYVAVKTDGSGAFTLKMVMPYRLLPPGSEERQIHRIEARQVSKVGGPLPSEPLLLTIERMVETIIMGMMATLFGIVLAIPVSFLAARNLMSGSWLTMAVYYVTRTIFNIIRSIEPLIWALIAVVWVGLGPFAGIVALTVHSIAALGKLYSEAIENIDKGPIEAIHATGATKLQTIMYAVVPQMISPFVSFSIYRWDINVRMSTVIGLVGGGGIGFLLIQYIRLLDYRAAGIAVWFIAVTVAVLDYVSSEIRQRFV
ncbi:MAG: phosphonate ABC transporter, permease protein PhnE [Spirochaetota bacterium]